MPCDSITIYRVDIEKVKDLPRLAKAMKAAGWEVHSSSKTHLSATNADGLTVEIRRTGDRTTMETRARRYSSAGDWMQETAAELTRGYVKQTITEAAKRFGWEVKEEQSEKEQEKLSLLRSGW